jgi:circadian clock protein KaiC
VLYISFDETQLNFYRRAQGLGVELSGTGELFHFLQVDPAELSPGEMSTIIREHVENRGVKVVTLDSLSGYQNAMLEEQYMILHMHELLTYLNQQGVLTLLVLAQHGLVGTMQTPIDLTYLSDTVLLLRFFESAGELRRSIAVMKKRIGSHDSNIREYRIDNRGIRVGEALTQFSGVLTGVPAFHGLRDDLLTKRGTD